MADVIITEFMDEAVVARLSEQFDVTYDPGLAERPDDLAQMTARAQALVVRNRTKVDAGLIDQADRLKIVGRLGVGLDNMMWISASDAAYPSPAVSGSTPSVWLNTWWQWRFS